MTTSIYWTEIDTPLGSMLLAATDQGLCGLYFHDQRHLPLAIATWRREHARFAAAAAWVRAYFEGKHLPWDLPMDLISGTPFQREVWQALRAIPAGQTCSYGQLAARLGRPAAVRAVGAAVGRNPLSIIVPCHRVIGGGGALTGYAGGVDRKRWLLNHEAAMMTA